MDFKERSLLPEKMDQPGVDPAEIHQALKELEIINKLLGGYHIIFNALDQIRFPNEQITILDLGCGGGDMLRAVADRARKKKLNVLLKGIDWNPVMTDFARKHAVDYPNIEFLTMSIFDDALKNQKAHVSMNTLFCHHFTNEEIVLLLKRMVELSSVAVIINDLHRHWFAYHSIKVITALLSKTYLVKYDGPLSVARSLRRQEWEQLLHKAEIKNYSLKWKWAWRWQIIIYKDDAFRKL